MRHPETEAEMVELEDLCVNNLHDNPRYIIYNVTRDNIRQELLQHRAFDLKHKARTCIFDKPTGKLIMGYRLLRETAYQQGIKEIQSIPAYTLVNKQVRYLNNIAIQQFPEVFRDPAVMARSTWACVDRTYRGKGVGNFSMNMMVA